MNQYSRTSTSTLLSRPTVVSDVRKRLFILHTQGVRVDACRSHGNYISGARVQSQRKRSVVKRILSKMRQTFHVAAAEADEQDIIGTAC